MFYLDLFRQLERQKVRYVLVGGLAMNLHGVPRATMDVDIMVALDEPNLRAFIDVARALQLKPVAPVPLEDLLDPAKRRQWAREKNMIAFGLQPLQPGAPTIDVLIEPPLDVNAALQRAQIRNVENTRVFLAAIEDLIYLKERTGRQQDQADIGHLRRLLKRTT